MKPAKINLQYILGLTLVFFFASCTNKESKKLESTFDKTLTMVDSLQAYQLNEGWVSRNLNSNKHKIVTYVDGTCSQCIYELENWKNFLVQEGIEDVEFVVYMRTLELRVIEELLRQVGFDYPVIIDYKDTFNIVNELSPRKIEQTFFLNQDNQVVLVGNPLYDIKLKELYLNTIRQL